MKLLIDSDAFCKLGIAGLLREAARTHDTELAQCGRLAALPHMLRRGSLRKRYGGAACDLLRSLAEKMPCVPPADVAALEALIGVEDIDPGEAQLFATAAQFELPVLTGDKRAVRAVAKVPKMAPALAGRVVVLEASLIALCDRLGPADLCRRLLPVARYDTMLRVCFAPGSAPHEGLRSYYEAIAAEAAPLVLWDPRKDSA